MMKVIQFPNISLQTLIMQLLKYSLGGWMDKLEELMAEMSYCIAVQCCAI